MKIKDVLMQQILINSYGNQEFMTGGPQELKRPQEWEP